MKPRPTLKPDVKQRDSGSKSLNRFARSIGCSIGLAIWARDRDQYDNPSVVIVWPPELGEPPKPDEARAKPAGR
jgi:hypothetical protein